jgi:phosphatidylinositol glycan class B
MLIFGVCLVFRLCCALCLSTAFAPDEFWQGPEVAHKLVFGYDSIISLYCMCLESW